MNAILALKKNAYVQIPAALITISLMIALPFLVHLLPPVGDVQVGAILLPIFYVPLVAIFLFHPSVAIVAALAAPYINHLITGRPALPMAASLSVQVLVFSALLLVLHRREIYTTWIVPLAYLLATVASGAVSFIMMPTYSLSQWASLIAVGLPGLIILAILYRLMLSTAKNAS